MRSNRILTWSCAALMVAAGAGVTAGCGSGYEEIPLAKVPPPPENFTKSQASAKIPGSASPANANERRR
ncbi:hypothetical protein OJF2_38620 [Aquisphaera giovannonii]|uniref:Lipoprotein n=1 Tax=Aquisphaera giovannonii TaxID=406548 RepID=A0A5B9W5R0_9BACT|nr:hypothetical protein [Aquisphaera giovannonii]QEH35311.1 hypothetical protein OJF2_38620 [Aquisphaera giovannonii]